MVGMERSILPAIAEQEFHLAAHDRGALVHRRLRRHQGAHELPRRAPLRSLRPQARAGRAAGSSPLPVPFLLMWAPSWNWVLVANVLLGVSQGLTWSTTVIMKIDLAGPEQPRARDGAQRVRRLLRGRRRARSRPARSPRATGCARSRSTSASRFVALGLVLSALARPRDEAPRRRTRRSSHGELPPRRRPRSARSSGARRCSIANLSSVSQAGLVNNLNDGMAWGLFPLFFAAARMDLGQIGWLAAIYPATWGIGAALHRRAVGSRRAQVAHRVGHVGAGGRHRAS